MQPLAQVIFISEVTRPRRLAYHRDTSLCSIRTMLVAAARLCHVEKHRYRRCVLA